MTTREGDGPRKRLAKVVYGLTDWHRTYPDWEQAPPFAVDRCYRVADAAIAFLLMDGQVDSGHRREAAESGNCEWMGHGEAFMAGRCDCGLSG